MSNNEKITNPTFAEIVDEIYHGVGVTGAEALSEMLNDYNEGRLTEFLQEHGVTELEFMMTVNSLAVKWASMNLLNVMRGVGQIGSRPPRGRK